MLMYPSVRKGLITEPTSAPFTNFADSVQIQDDQFLPEFYDYSQQQQQYQQHQQQQPRLLSPFQYHPDFQFVSPPSSTPSSPTFSSPSSSISHPPSTAADCTAGFDGSSFEAPSMTPASSYNPNIQVQNSSPPTSQPQLYPPQYRPQYMFDSPMLAQPTVANNHTWEGNLQLCGPARFPNGLPGVQDSQKTSSSFSNRANGYNNGATVPKPLPTPVQTPVQNSFLASSFQNYDPSHDAGNESELAMRQQPRQSDFSLAPSVSSVSRNSPVTPQTSLDELDNASKAMAANEYGSQNGNALSIGIPKLNRTISDIYQDELYNPALVTTPQVSKPTGQNMLHPYRNVFADRIQAANQGHMSARSQSPAMMNRERSPFRQNSHLATEFSNSGLPAQPLPTSMSMSMGQNGEPKTISPKDALLDFNESEDTSMPPLFSSNQPDFNLGDTLGLRRESSSAFRPSQNFSTMESFPGQYSTHVGPQFPFTQPPPQHPGRQPQQHLLHHTPEFPAPLPSLESSNGEMGEMTSPQRQNLAIQAKEGIPRPGHTTSDGGTYTCTYHGCTLRFETPSKLQKHKREAHRQTTPGGHLATRDTASLRNSQAGPHKCERINPSTGKPCNSIFSRPYDLTRHEDTIHNARKQKVRCHLCTEEKTFSRNDALTRHMRVVHPEVDWPGKQRRRGH